MLSERWYLDLILINLWWKRFKAEIDREEMLGLGIVGIWGIAYIEVLRDSLGLKITEFCVGKWLVKVFNG